MLHIDHLSPAFSPPKAKKPDGTVPINCAAAKKYSKLHRHLRYQPSASESSRFRAIPQTLMRRAKTPPTPDNAVESAIPMRNFQTGINPATTPQLASAKTGAESISSSGA
jgi:hypothetical protein